MGGGNEARSDSGWKTTSDEAKLTSFKKSVDIKK
jgi:hypothetical protein